MGKIIKFEMSDKMLLKRTLREATEELKFLYKISGWKPDTLPWWIKGLEKDEYELWEKGDIEL
jgi:hypothetical protein